VVCLGVCVSVGVCVCVCVCVYELHQPVNIVFRVLHVRKRYCQLPPR